MEFGVADCLVFAGMLLLSFGIGIFFSVRDRRGNSTDNYYFGKHEMGVIPVALSTCVSLVSAVTVIGFPVETYKYGAVMAWLSVGVVIGALIATVYFIPILRKLNVKCVYEILERRYNNKVRLIASITQVIFTMCKMGVITYLPALALSAVTPLHLSWVIAVTTVVCTAYTTMGGMKAVIWTDVFQSVVMIIGSLAVFGKVAYLIRDQPVVEILKESGRWNLFDFSSNPTKRLDFWNLSSMVVFFLFAFCCHQAYVQRHLSCRTTRDAQKSLMLSTLPQTALLLLSTLVGCVTFVYYKNCDPLKSGKISTYDQAVPYMALEVFSDVPGVAGLFVSAAYAGSLSSLSSGISAVSIIVLEDFILPSIGNKIMKVSNLVLSRIITCILGVIVMCLAYLSVLMGSSVLRFITTVHGILSGSMFGLFVLALFLPWSNWKGAIIGQLVGISFTVFLTIGAIVYKDEISTNQIIPLLPQECLNVSESVYVMETTRKHGPALQSLITNWFSLSHYLYSPIVLILTVVFGLLFSFITGAEDPAKADTELFVPLIDSKVFPRKLRRFFRFGVPEEPQYYIGMELK